GSGPIPGLKASAVWHEHMRLPRLTLALVALISLHNALPASAKVLKEGKPSGGFYWQNVEGNSGKVSYLCRSKDDGKLHKGEECEKAGAKKP
ncbi:MAG: hypothetical protein VKP63_08610, partial [Cyanobacteriota bacterium]|nr:hypothetical protein [Cyanobacteriota bacterium]